MKFEHDKIEEIELLHTEALADRLQFLALSERNPKVSLWLSHSADRLKIQLEDNADLERRLAAARKDSERLDWLLSHVGSEEANGKLIFWKACQYDTREEIDQIIARIDAAIRNSQTEEARND